MIKVGIFFGGQSREREISFAGGRTVFDNLDKSLFSPVPIFIDSLGNLILLKWEYLYKGTIRDFYPVASRIHDRPSHFQYYIEHLSNLDESEIATHITEIGEKVSAENLPSLMDFAFLCLHGEHGEDGDIQGILNWQGIPFSGSGVFGSALGIDKKLQSHLLAEIGFNRPASLGFSSDELLENPRVCFDTIKSELGDNFVVKAAHQGSSIGISILKSPDFSAFEQAIDKALFRKEIFKSDWEGMSVKEKIAFAAEESDIRHGVGFPLQVGTAASIIHSPEMLIEALDQWVFDGDAIHIQSLSGESEILVESMIQGKEFSCIVIQDLDGKPLALPPTEIVKGSDLFDYRSKYLPGMARKITPIELPIAQIEDIETACCSLFQSLQFNVYARIDGFITATGEVFLNDPNTTSGMMPSSFFFHQAAEIGLNPSQFITYIIYASLSARISENKSVLKSKALISTLKNALEKNNASSEEKQKVAVIMGGYSSERHISIESGRNIYEKLSSSVKYQPMPVFLAGNEESFQLHEMPINIMLKDNADDIKEKIESFDAKGIHPIIQKTQQNAADITQLFAGKPLFAPRPLSLEQLAEEINFTFIALHGRPGEDGALQTKLKEKGIPFNGSDVESSQKTINKYETNEVLRKNGMLVANHKLYGASLWKKDSVKLVDEIEEAFGFPLIAKPADDGCSSAVKKIDTREELSAFLSLMFREDEPLLEAPMQTLELKPNEEFPIKNEVLIESLITSNDADHFLEITGGMYTTFNADGSKSYHVFEPSEALATGKVLSLEEKFLAGEGQNITPARFSHSAERQAEISSKVRNDLAQAATLLNVEGYCRIDAFVRIYSDKVDTVFIEINSLPGMTPATCIFHQAAIDDLTPFDFIHQIISYGIDKKKYVKRSH